MPDDPQFNELAQYFATSPNSIVAGCMNTHDEVDGVVFPGIEPQEDAFCFVGRDSILAAVAVLYDRTPDEIDEILGDEVADAKEYVKNLERELKDYKTRWLKLVKIMGTDG